MRGALLVLPVLATLAACGSSGGTAAPSAPSATVPAAAARPGPFTVRVDHCGKLNAHQQSLIGVPEKSGAVLTVTSHAASPERAQVTVDFMRGSQVQAENVTGPDAPYLAAGQSVKVAVANVDDGGDPGSPSDACKAVSYQAYRQGSSVPAGTWNLPQG